MSSSAKKDLLNPLLIVVIATGVAGADGAFGLTTLLGLLGLSKC